jgi:HK97 family phage prohead protease
MSFNHDPNYILARSKEGGTLKLEVDATGLKYSYDSPKRSYANDLLDAIDQGDVSQSSFAFKIKSKMDRR